MKKTRLAFSATHLFQLTFLSCTEDGDELIFFVFISLSSPRRPDFFLLYVFLPLVQHKKLSVHDFIASNLIFGSFVL